MASWAEETREDDEREQTPMTDREHLLTFGWAWDDPGRVEEPV